MVPKVNYVALWGLFMQIEAFLFFWWSETAAIFNVQHIVIVVESISGAGSLQSITKTAYPPPTLDHSYHLNNQPQNKNNKNKTRSRELRKQPNSTTTTPLFFLLRAALRFL